MSKPSNKIIIGYREQQRNCANCAHSYSRKEVGVGEWLMCGLLDSMTTNKSKWNPIRENGVCEKWES